MTGNKKLDFLERKFLFLQKTPNSDKDKDDVLQQIYQLSPDDFEYRLKYVQSLFDRASVWKAITEFMRLQADVEALGLDSEEKRQERATDTLKSMSAEKILSELE